MSQSITRQRFKELLGKGAIGDLFIELGWDHADDTVPVEAGKTKHELRTVANKRGFAVLVHTAAEVPDRNLRQSIEKKVARIHYEHLIVFRSADGAQQVWQLAIRRPNQPITFHETTWHKGQEPELLYQKLSGLFIPLEQEQGITLVDVRESVTREFERQTKDVTKKFYTGFKQEHDRFLKFIEGLNDQDAKKWYASLMLNRLMFIYFMQRKGFMNGDTHYLKHKLEETTKLEGKDKFYGFYRKFLRVLFHQGLGSPERTPELEKRIGKVPYLNGGLFDEHPLEEENPALKIKDEAFKKLFAFFDEWKWTLDTRQHASGKEVNPDVIGYIFEQYINDRAQMGAYYTKEDITAYIGKNTIIPWLFDAAKKEDAKAFKADGGVWELLREDPDRYIYTSVKHGVDAELLKKDDGKGPWWKSCLFDDLPANVKKGLDPEQKDLWKVRKANDWNKPATVDKGLPTEIWRETIDRRKRYLEVRRKLVAGEVTAINDLITLNLDIAQFAQDVIHETASHDLVWGFYDAIQQVTVLDPTCGSGAFLFAALNILEPMYEACLKRMQWFVDVDDEMGTGRKHTQFREILARMAQHPKPEYFIYKSIILNNLYGVDIMPEAVEIAKLRLFLKLVSTVEPDAKKPSYGIEPLPDIDFNIRAGNTLVGFGTKAELYKGLDYTLDGQLAKPVIEENCEIVSRLYERFKSNQLKGEEDPKTSGSAKADLLKRLSVLRDELDRYLGKQYGKDKDHNAKQYEAWKKSHKPFHWFAEYYGIVEGRGGFDVIIGNPPWMEYSKAKEDYTVKNYETETCGNLYGMCIERAVRIRGGSGASGFIVQLPLANSPRMSAVRKLLVKRSGNLHVITLDDRPGKLFEGLQHCRSTIFMSVAPSRTASSALWVSRYQRWPTALRDELFKQVHYTAVHSNKIYPDQFPKYPSSVLSGVFESKCINQVAPLGLHVVGSTKPHFVFYQEAMQYWAKATVGLPYYSKNGIVGAPAHGRYLYFNSANDAALVGALVNSSLFYCYFIAFSDCFHLNDSLVRNFPLADGVTGSAELSKLGKDLAKQLRSKAGRTTITTKDGDEIEYAEFSVAVSKPILDEIDALLGVHYGLSEEELDFVINYDIKYRMGEELEGEE